MRQKTEIYIDNDTDVGNSLAIFCSFSIVVYTAAWSDVGGLEGNDISTVNNHWNQNSIELRV